LSVAVIAFFIALNLAITTARTAAINATRRATVTGSRFIARITRLPGLYDSVAATRERTGIAAGVIINRVAIITGFVTLRKTVAARRISTQRGTQTRWTILSAKIAFFSFLYDRVTATCQAAIIRAGIGVFCVGVVTTFPGLDQAITAVGQRALRRTAVVIAAVAIIAGLSGFDDAVATYRWGSRGSGPHRASANQAQQDSKSAHKTTPVREYFSSAPTSEQGLNCVYERAA
jgi:hypothetical protein